MFEKRGQQARRNFKQLKLVDPPKRSRTPSLQDAQVPGGTANSYHHQRSDSLTDQIGQLEIGVEFKLDIRQEDLQLVSEIGAGNGGTVSKVVHLPTKTIMAKKSIHIEAKPEVRKQIIRELHIMHECHSPHIVSFYGAFLSAGEVIMCMEYMDCGSLDTITKRGGPIPPAVLGQITLAVLSGLTYLYNVHRIIHRDVKPSNILINSHGQVKLIDFGVSGELINSIADTFVGTSTYMSPERIQGAKYSVKSDVWSLGISLLELARGKFPFDSERKDERMGILELLQQIVNEPPPKLPSDVGSPELQSFINRCLIKDIEQRPSPQDLLDDPFLEEARNSPINMEAWVKRAATGKRVSS